MREKRALIPPELRAELDCRLCSLFMSLACFRFADTVLMYCPVNGEPDILPIAYEAVKRGKKIAFPVSDAKSSTMIFRYVDSPDELICGAFSIPEPRNTCAPFTGEGNAVCIVPGFTFDRFGYRIGYGRGFYDRFLRGFTGISAGLVYSELFEATGELPHGYYDIAANVIVTEKEVLTTNADRSKEIRT